MTHFLFCFGLRRRLNSFRGFFHAIFSFPAMISLLFFPLLKTKSFAVTWPVFNCSCEFCESHRWALTFPHFSRGEGGLSIFCNVLTNFLQPVTFNYFLFTKIVMHWDLLTFPSPPPSPNQCIKVLLWKERHLSPRKSVFHFCTLLTTYILCLLDRTSLVVGKSIQKKKNYYDKTI